MLRLLMILSKEGDWLKKDSKGLFVKSKIVLLEESTM
jgi:hypothetical protein